MWVTNIQRMSFHDGPGIRTTVFLKGCSIHCPWCSNAENIDINSPYGRNYNADELANELLKDEWFWIESSGGITFSGGEPFLQIKAINEVIKYVDNSNVNIILESSLFVNHVFVNSFIDLINGVIADIKILNSDRCKEVLGGNINDYLTNVEYLVQNNKIIMFRIPCCPDYTLTEENIIDIKKFLSSYSDIPVEIFSVHHIAESKYRHLGIQIPEYKEASIEQIEKLYNELTSVSENIQIVKL